MSSRASPLLPEGDSTSDRCNTLTPVILHLGSYKGPVRAGGRGAYVSLPLVVSGLQDVFMTQWPNSGLSSGLMAFY